MNTVVYHSNCFDGMGAAWAAWKRFGNTTKYIPVNYTDKPPQFSPEDTVIFVDFCYSREVMESIRDKVKSLTILDHHKTAEAACKDLTGCNIVFDMNRSGAGITWDYLFPEEERPDLIDYIEDRDLWRYKLNHSEIVNAAIEAMPYTFEAFEELYLTDLQILIRDGQSILKYKNKQIFTITKHYDVIDLDGYKVAIVNSSCLFSEIANALCYVTGIGACWYKNKERILVSLRCDNDIHDVSEIAQVFGGGGHKRAAGFNMSIDEFMEILKG